MSGFPVSEEELEEVAIESGVLDFGDDFLPPDVQAISARPRNN